MQANTPSIRIFLFRISLRAKSDFRLSKPRPSSEQSRAPDPEPCRSAAVVAVLQLFERLAHPLKKVYILYILYIYKYIDLLFSPFSHHDSNCNTAATAAKQSTESGKIHCKRCIVAKHRAAKSKIDKMLRGKGEKLYIIYYIIYIL